MSEARNRQRQGRHLCCYTPQFTITTNTPVLYISTPSQQITQVVQKKHRHEGPRSRLLPYSMPLFSRCTPQTSRRTSSGRPLESSDRFSQVPAKSSFSWLSPAPPLRAPLVSHADGHAGQQRQGGVPGTAPQGLLAVAAGGGGWTGRPGRLPLPDLPWAQAVQLLLQAGALSIHTYSI